MGDRMQNKRTILVVDDEEDVRDLLSIILESIGYNVQTAANGLEAWDMINGQPDIFDLVISDIRMPGMDGIELLEKIKGRYPFKPVVSFITGFSDLSIEDAYARGVCGYVKKPFSKKDIVEVVEKALASIPVTKREYDRVKAEFEVKLSFSSIDEAILARTLNIGQGGMFICYEQLPEVGVSIDFEVFFQSGKIKSFSGAGKVVWIRKEGTKDFPRGFGVKFMELEEEHSKAIDEFVKERKIMAFIPKG